MLDLQIDAKVSDTAHAPDFCIHFQVHYQEKIARTKFFRLQNDLNGSTPCDKFSDVGFGGSQSVNAVSSARDEDIAGRSGKKYVVTDSSLLRLAAIPIQKKDRPYLKPSS